ncbi:hypothetical protein PMI17_00161 [Pantoea sp. GM01]|nr:hypothetical protein PMI17_00161 [Pantoea sp. GM01]
MHLIPSEEQLRVFLAKRQVTYFIFAINITLYFSPNLTASR